MYIYIYIYISEQGGDPAAYSIPAHEPKGGPGGGRCFVSLLLVSPPGWVAGGGVSVP